MDSSSAIVVLSLDEQRYGLWLSAVERVTRIVLITPLPKSPEIVLGVVNVGGEIVPVVDLRRRFRLPARELRLEDQLVLARTPRRRLGLVVDSVAGVQIAEPASRVPSHTLPGDTAYLQGIVKTRDGMILIHDLATFLALDEECSLDAALAAPGGIA